jgi:hypothetical protein
MEPLTLRMGSGTILSFCMRATTGIMRALEREAAS